MTAAAVGISAFAFQGTNAHVLLAPATDQSFLRADARPATWQHRRFWFAPAPHQLIAGVMWHAASQAVELCLQLQQPAAAFLWDHQVGPVPAWSVASCLSLLIAMRYMHICSASRRMHAGPGLQIRLQLPRLCTPACLFLAIAGSAAPQVNGRVLMPGAAMLEASWAACHTLADAGVPFTRCLTSVSIPAPLILPGRSAAVAPTVTITVSPISGQILLQSAAASSAHRFTSHMQGFASAISYHQGRTVVHPTPKPAIAALMPLDTAAMYGPVAQIKEIQASEPAFRCHPAAIDSTMHLALYLGQADGRTRVPGERPTTPISASHS